MDSINKSGKATSTTFVPSTPDNWIPVPTTAAEALDQLAYEQQTPTQASQVPYTPGDPSDWSPQPVQVALALDQLAARPIGGGGGGASNIFVYRAGEPTPSGNVYATWTDVFVARQAIQGHVVIEIDSSISICDIPSGSYDLTNTTLAGLITDAALTQVTLSGSVFDVPFIRDLSIVPNGGTIIYNNNSDQYLTLTNTTLYSANGAQFLIFVYLSTLFLTMEEGSVLSGYPGYAALFCDAGILNVSLSGIGTQIQDNSIYTISTSVNFVVDAMATVSANQPQLPGGVHITNAALAGQIAYSPANIPNWSGTAPTSVADALDRIASMIGPIV